MASRTKIKKQNTKEAVYQPSKQDRVAIEKYMTKRKDQLSVRIAVTDKGGTASLAIDHPHEAFGQAQMMQAFATADLDFASGILSQLANASSKGQTVDQAGVNFMLSVIKGIGPKDQVETMLAAQMAAVHVATMTFARRLNHVENLPQQDSAERAFNKLTRTFAMQMEALKRYRTGGEQKVTVQHVSVGEGGQAIVGNVTQAPREEAQDKAPTPPLAIADAKTVPMPMIEKSKEATPVPARRRRESRREK